jgi:hypothetical protein
MWERREKPATFDLRLALYDVMCQFVEYKDNQKNVRI